MLSRKFLSLFLTQKTSKNCSRHEKMRLQLWTPSICEASHAIPFDKEWNFRQELNVKFCQERDKEFSCCCITTERKKERQPKKKLQNEKRGTCLGTWDETLNLKRLTRREWEPVKFCPYYKKVLNEIKSILVTSSSLMCLSFFKMQSVSSQRDPLYSSYEEKEDWQSCLLSWVLSSYALVANTSPKTDFTFILRHALSSGNDGVTKMLISSSPLLDFTTTFRPLIPIQIDCLLLVTLALTISDKKYTADCQLWVITSDRFCAFRQITLNCTSICSLNEDRL